MPLDTTFPPTQPFETRDLLAKADMSWPDFRRTEHYGDFLRPLRTADVLGATSPSTTRSSPPWGSTGATRRGGGPRSTQSSGRCFRTSTAPSSSLTGWISFRTI